MLQALRNYISPPNRGPRQEGIVSDYFSQKGNPTETFQKAIKAYEETLSVLEKVSSKGTSFTEAEYNETLKNLKNIAEKELLFSRAGSLSHEKIVEDLADYLRAHGSVKMGRKKLEQLVKEKINQVVPSNETFERLSIEFYSLGNKLKSFNQDSLYYLYKLDSSFYEHYKKIKVESRLFNNISSLHNNEEDTWKFYLTVNKIVLLNGIHSKQVEVGLHKYKMVEGGPFPFTYQGTRINFFEADNLVNSLTEARDKESLHSAYESFVSRKTKELEEQREESSFGFVTLFEDL